MPASGDVAGRSGSDGASGGSSADNQLHLSPLELLLPGGYARHILVIGGNCPLRLLPTLARSAPGMADLVDLIVVAPSAAECGSASWRKATLSRVRRQLAPDGIAYLLVPVRWRWQFAALVLRGQGLCLDTALAHVPNAQAARQQLVPLAPALARYAFLHLGGSRSWRRVAAGMALKLPAGAQLLAAALPSVGLVVRRPGSRQLFAWLAELCADSGRGGQAILFASWYDQEGGAVAHWFPQNAIRPAAIAKLALTPAVIERTEEGRRLADLGPAAGAAGGQVARLIAMGQVGGQAVLVQSSMQGKPASTLIHRRPERLASAWELVNGWLERWNLLTMRRQRVDRRWLEEGTLVPARLLAPRLRRGSDCGSDYCCWLERLCAECADMDMPLVDTHNDLTAANLLIDDDRLSIVDWEMGCRLDLPLIDFFYATVDLTAASTGYRSWIEAFRASFTPGGTYFQTVARFQQRLVTAMGLPGPMVQLCLHACWLRRATRDVQRPSAARWQPFADIVQLLAEQALM